MALYTRYVLVVDAATGNDTQGSGSSASVKDSDSISGTTLVITNAGGGSTVTRADAAAFSGPPVAGVDTIIFTDTVGGLGMFHIGTVSGDNKTLTLIETPATGTSVGNPWGVGGYFASIARAALVVLPTNLNAGADDHVYVKAGSGYSGTTKITFSNAAGRSRPLVFEGYTTTLGDGGQATYDITATATVAFEPNAQDQTFRNFKLTNSGVVSSFTCLKAGGSAGRWVADNIWADHAGTTGIGLNMSVANSHVLRSRGHCTGTTGIGIQAGAQTVTIAFSLSHDCKSAGIHSALTGVFSIADTCGTGTANGGFTGAGGSTRLWFCTAYNQGTTGDGCRFTDAAGTISSLALGSIFANNAAYGINRVAFTAAFPILLEAYNDFFSNGTDTRNNAGDTTGNDAAPTDKTLDPQFTDAENQDFSIGSNLRGAVSIDIGNL